MQPKFEDASNPRDRAILELVPAPDDMLDEGFDDPKLARPHLVHGSWLADIADGGVTTDLARLAEAALDRGDGMQARRLLWTAAQITWAVGDDDSRDSVRDAADRMGLPADDPWLLAISAAVGSADTASIGEAAAMFERSLAAPADLLLVGMASAITGDALRSRALLARAAPELRGEGDDAPLASLLVMQAWNDIHLGRWTEAASEIEEGGELASETGQPMWGLVADVMGALLGCMRGDEDEVERTLARIDSPTIDYGNGWVASMIKIVRDIDELIGGRPDVAFIRLRERIGSSPEALWAIDHVADAAVLSGRVDDGRAVLEASCGKLGESRGPLTLAAHAYAGAVLADDRAADERHGLALDDLADWPIHEGRLQLHRGRWLRRQRRIADSRVPLRAAHDQFEALGATHLAGRARRELRASGERIRRTESAAWDVLSPQESVVAELAADGLSNREIGEQLFLSHRTVGSYLYRIFPKLGVTSRGELSRMLAKGVTTRRS